MVYKVIGVMSGSSLDGVDIAYVELEENGGKWSYTILEADCLPYEKSWLAYSHKHFTGKFIADSMSLLRRPVDESDGYRVKYQLAEKFAFQNMPVLTRQGELFG